MQALGENFANYTPEQWQKYLQDNQTSLARQSQLNSLRGQYIGGGLFSGGTGAGSTGIGGSSSSNSSSSSSSGGLFGSLGGITGYVDQAKDLARFRLGLDQEQAKFSRGLREEESQSDFGRTYKLSEQQITGQKDLTNLQQSATTDRLQKQLESQQAMQMRGFDQQNLYRAQSAALALRGLR